METAMERENNDWSVRKEGAFENELQNGAGFEKSKAINRSIL